MIRGYLTRLGETGPVISFNFYIKKSYYILWHQKSTWAKENTPKTNHDMKINFNKCYIYQVYIVKYLSNTFYDKILFALNYYWQINQELNTKLLKLATIVMRRMSYRSK